MPETLRVILVEPNVLVADAIGRLVMGWFPWIDEFQTFSELALKEITSEICLVLCSVSVLPILLHQKEMVQGLGVSWICYGENHANLELFSPIQWIEHRTPDEAFIGAIYKSLKPLRYLQGRRVVNLPTGIKYIAIPNQEQVDVINIQDILRLESHNNYTTIFPKKGNPIVSSKHIKSYEERLPADLFYRVHNSHLINLSCISGYIRSKTGSLILTDGSIVPISASKKKELVTRILI